MQSLLDIFKSVKKQITKPTTPEAIWEFMTESERKLYPSRDSFIIQHQLTNVPIGTFTAERALEAFGGVKSSKPASQEDMIEIMHDAQPELYQKSGTFKARLGKPGERIATEIDGEKETQKTVKDGEIVIKGPKDEMYVVSEKTFRQRYEVDKDPTEEYQNYKAIGLIRAYEYVGDDFKFIASWDEEMICKPGDYLASPVKDAEDTEYPEVYRIERTVFDETYKEIEE